MEITEQKIKQMIDNAFDERERSNQYNVSPIPIHVHSGVDSPRINPRDFEGFVTVQVTDSTVAPTDTPINGTLRFQYDATHWNLWIRINKLWKTIALA